MRMRTRMCHFVYCIALRVEHCKTRMGYTQAQFDAAIYMRILRETTNSDIVRPLLFHVDGYSSFILATTLLPIP